MSFWFIFHFCSNTLFERKKKSHNYTSFSGRYKVAFKVCLAMSLCHRKSFYCRGIVHFESLYKHFCLVLLTKRHFLLLDWQLGSVTMKEYKDQYNFTVLSFGSRRYQTQFWMTPDAAGNSVPPEPIQLAEIQMACSANSYIALRNWLSTFWVHWDASAWHHITC